MSNSSGFRVVIADSDPVMAKIVLNQVACTGHLAEDIGESGTSKPGAIPGCLDFVIAHWTIASKSNFAFLESLEKADPPIPYIVMLRDKDGSAKQLKLQLKERGSLFSLSQPFSTDKLEEVIGKVIASLPEPVAAQYRERMGNDSSNPFDIGGGVPTAQPAAPQPQNNPPTQAGDGPAAANPDSKPLDALGNTLFELEETRPEEDNREDESLSEEERAVVNWFDDPEFLGSTQRLRDSIHFRVSFNENDSAFAVEKAQEPSAAYGETPHSDAAVDTPDASDGQTGGNGSAKKQRDHAAETAKESTAVTARRHFSKGKEALAAKDYTQAIRNFTAVLQLKPGSPQAYKGLAVAFRGKGDWNRSCYFLGRACQSFIWCGRFEEGLAMHEEMKRRGITTVHPFGAVAQTLVKRGRLDKALRLLEQGRKLAPKDADLLWAYALLLSFKGDNKSAIRALDDLLSSAAKHKDARNLRAKLLSKPPKPDKNGKGDDSQQSHDLDSLSDE